MTGKEESPFLDYMNKNNIPLTRKNYMAFAMPDVPEDEIGAELESEMPDMFKSNEEDSKTKVRIVKKTK